MSGQLIGRRLPAKQRLITAITERMAELHIGTHRQLAELAGCHKSTISWLLSEKGHMITQGLPDSLDSRLKLW